MRRWLWLIALYLLWPTLTWAAMAFDATTCGTLGAGTISWTHTPVGTPRGVIVYVMHNSLTDSVTSVTYGGVALVEVSGSPAPAPGSGMTYGYFLGATIPTGAQTVVVTQTNTSHPCVVTITAATDTVVTNTATISATVDDPSTTLTLSGQTSFVSQGFTSQRNDPTHTTPLANWTSHSENDAGSTIFGHYTYNIVASTDVTVGLTTDMADEISLLAIGVRESAAPAQNFFFRRRMSLLSPKEWLHALYRSFRPAA